MIEQNYKTQMKKLFCVGQEWEVKKNTKVKFYPDDMTCKVICWDKPKYLPNGYEEVSKKKKKSPKNGLNEETSTNAEKNKADSVKRAKDKIFEIALANNWDYMVTLTLDGDKIDRYSSEEVLKVISKWLDNKVQRNNLRYLIVPEYHKDKAIHFHGLMSGDVKIKHSGTYKIPGKKAPVKINTLTRRKLDKNSPNIKDVFNVVGFPYGFSTAVKIEGNSERVAMYMTKYIVKDLDKIFGSYYKAGGKIKRELDFALVNLDFDEVGDIENCTTVFLPDNLGSVRYVLTDFSVVSSLLDSYERSYNI